MVTAIPADTNPKRLPAHFTRTNAREVAHAGGRRPRVDRRRGLLRPPYALVAAQPLLGTAVPVAEHGMLSARLWRRADQE